MPVFVALGVIAGILAVDHRAGWHSLLAHPVFSSVLIGSIMGQVDAALTVGLALELVYFAIVPMRGTKIPDQVAAGVVGAGITALLMRDAGEARFAFVCMVGTFLGFVAGEISARLTAPWFALQDRLLGGVEFSPQTPGRDLGRRISLIHVGSVAFIFLVEGLTVVVLSAVAGFVGHRSIRIADGALVRGALEWGALVAAIGAASIIHLFWQHRFRYLLVGCASLGAILLWLR